MKLIIFLSFILLLSSCSTNEKKADSDAAKRQYIQQQNPVDTIILRSTSFKKELVSNGKLKACKKSDLRFRISGEIESLPAKNGDFVETGQLIASLHKFDYEQALRKLDLQLKSARLELQNILIGQGYVSLDSSKIPAHIWDMATVKSGYAEVQNDIRTAKVDLQSTELRAPFPGKIGNITQEVYEQVNIGEPFCTLIDDSEFEVEFNLVESEITEVSLNDPVKIIPFSISKTFNGIISEINPVIDENGLVQVRARVKNSGELIEGMNAKVVIEKLVPNQLVVPKSAVVLRDNQEVLFKCTRDSIAFWVYVKSTLQNSSSFSVIADPNKGGTLEAGDTVIVSGNLNLAHESRVIAK